MKRTADRHIRLAVTGLSGAGKTAFITGLIHQLLACSNVQSHSNLPLWHVSREKRLFGIERVQQPDFSIPSFDYKGAMSSLTSSAPNWPQSTRNISELRLAIHFQPKSGVRGKLFERSTLMVDIVDYPGEWLLDLPLLKMSFVEWCLAQQQRLKILQQSNEYKDFEDKLRNLSMINKADLSVIEELARQYQTILNDMVHQHGFYLAQPGRMLLPGDLEGSPLLTWFPLLHVPAGDLEKLDKRPIDDSYFQVLKQRYYAYVTEVVKPFYQQYFRHFDRQVVLVDSLTALNKGQAQFADMTHALTEVLESFQFGQSNWLNRLFSPKIDKLLFVASKCDQVTRDQQSNLLHLLNDMLLSSQQLATIKGCHVETMAISAIKATKHGMVEHHGDKIEVVQGRVKAKDKPVTVFPGEVPKKLPKVEFWQQQGFHFKRFLPPISLVNEAKPKLEHIRLDHLIQFLIGDKFD